MFFTSSDRHAALCVVNLDAKAAGLRRVASLSSAERRPSEATLNSSVQSAG